MSRFLPLKLKLLKYAVASLLTGLLVTNCAPLSDFKASSEQTRASNGVELASSKANQHRKSLQSSSAKANQRRKSLQTNGLCLASAFSYRLNNQRIWVNGIDEIKDVNLYGVASWYGKRFHGNQTANGEIYNMYARTAAHKSLPMNSLVEVTNLNNNKSIIVRINDRGPFIKGRIIDLSFKAAKELDMVVAGVVPVRVLVIVPGAEKIAKATSRAPLNTPSSNGSS